MLALKNQSNLLFNELKEQILDVKEQIRLLKETILNTQDKYQELYKSEQDEIVKNKTRLKQYKNKLEERIDKMESLYNNKCDEVNAHLENRLDESSSYLHLQIVRLESKINKNSEEIKTSKEHAVKMDNEVESITNKFNEQKDKFELFKSDQEKTDKKLNESIAKTRNIQIEIKKQLENRIDNTALKLKNLISEASGISKVNYSKLDEKISMSNKSRCADSLELLNLIGNVEHCMIDGLKDIFCMFRLKNEVNGETIDDKDFDKNNLNPIQDKISRMLIINCAYKKEIKIPVLTISQCIDFVVQEDLKQDLVFKFSKEIDKLENIYELLDKDASTNYKIDFRNEKEIETAELIDKYNIEFNNIKDLMIEYNLKGEDKMK